MKSLWIFLGLFLAQTAFGQVKGLTWEIKKENWSPSDEKSFQEFVRGLGLGKEKRLCSTTENCLKNKTANPLFFAKNPPGLKVFADCADLPHVLRGYFAWMNDLPFSFPSGMAAASADETKPDIRYSTFGNKIIRRKIVKTGDNFNTIAVTIANAISSAAFRVHPSRDVDTTGLLFNDFYPGKISRDSIVPGTVVYDPNGHVLVVYDVKDDGRIFMIDAHPDNSLTRQVYDEKKFIVSSPYYGAGFKKWRPMEVVGGKISPVKNARIADFSMVQYHGTAVGVNDANWKKRKFIIGSETVSFGDYVRRSLAKGNLKYHPVNELRESLRSICEDAKDRKNAVDDAIKKGIHLKPHPPKLPENIYGTSGEWESYSTPSRDARFKAAILSAKEMIISFVTKYRAADPVIVYQGADLVGDLKAVYAAESEACQITYKNSLDVEETINLDQIISRIYALSFDPYHCIEARWGEEDLRNCTDENKNLWYVAQQNLRNTLERNYDVRMDKTLQELPGSGLGSATKVDLSITNALNSL